MAKVATFLKKPIFQVDGFTLTFGVALVILAVAYFAFFKKK
jgi:hypothetical protein